MSLALFARRQLRAQRQHATLGTLSTALPGYPYCSAVPYVLDHDARPILLVSRLAEHTRNLTADPRVSLFVHEESDDVQAGGRVTLMGKAARVTEPDAGTARYVRYFSGAQALREQLDVDFYRIEPTSLRVVVGFAKAHWISREAYAPPAGDYAEEEEKTLALLNSRCAERLRRYCGRLRGTPVNDAALIGIDCDGFDIVVSGNVLRRNFETTAPHAAQAVEGIERALRSGTA
ncbi:MAG TPA: pyridoxamine 5'-phosphate oxidase family protein [Burkholderiales bacterium]